MTGTPRMFFCMQFAKQACAYRQSFAILRGSRAVSSAVEHYLDMVGVTSSILVPPTNTDETARSSGSRRFCFY